MNNKQEWEQEFCKTLFRLYYDFLQDTNQEAEMGSNIYLDDFIKWIGGKL
jgi:hypothetical protein